MQSPADNPSTNSTPSAQLGAELRRLRLQSQPTTDRPLTQQQLADKILVGGKGVISQFESGKRLPDDDTLQRYASATHADLEHLRALRQSAYAERRRSAELLKRSGAGADDTPQPRSRFYQRRYGVVVALLILCAAGATLGWVVLRQPRTQVDITLPARTVGYTTAVNGTVHGLRNDDLWLDIQSTGERNHHYTDHPCLRDGDHFSFPEIYVGRTGKIDLGVTFRLTVVAAPRGSAGDAALITYAGRPRGTATTYAGLPSAPAGVRTVAETYLVRQ